MVNDLQEAYSIIEKKLDQVNEELIKEIFGALPDDYHGRRDYDITSTCIEIHDTKGFTKVSNALNHQWTCATYLCHLCDQPLETKKKCLSLAKSVLEKNPGAVNVLSPEFEDHSPLTMACKRGFYEMVELLLSVSGIDVNLKTGIHGNDALQIALFYNRAEITKLLLNSGADIHSRNNDNSCTLQFACLNLNSFSMLIDEPNIFEDINHKDGNGDTPLMWAMRGIALKHTIHDRQFEHEPIFKTLLERSADINAQNVNGRTALMGAVYYKTSHIETLLKNNGADKSIADKDGRLADFYKKEFPIIEDFSFVDGY